MTAAFVLLLRFLLTFVLYNTGCRRHRIEIRHPSDTEEHFQHPSCQTAAEINDSRLPTLLGQEHITITLATTPQPMPKQPALTPHMRRGLACRLSFPPHSQPQSVMLHRLRGHWLCSTPHFVKSATSTTTTTTSSFL
jgi:hypothetical protein